VRPGIGTVVAEIPKRARGQERLLPQQVDNSWWRLGGLELEMDDVVEAIEEQWTKFQKPQR